MQDTMVTLAPEANVCTLSSVPEGFEPDIAVIHAFSLRSLPLSAGTHSLYYDNSSANNKTMTPADAVTVFQLDHNIGLISDQKRQGLLQSMQTLCKDVDIEEIVSINVSEEEFQHRSVDPRLHFSNSTRVKREPKTFTCEKTYQR